MKNVKLQHFRDAMKDFSEDFILIGGNACALLFDSVGAEFRETADLDVVLVIEKWSNEFAATLDQYIEEFGYTGRRFIRGDTGGTSHVHRFSITSTHPKFNEIPSQIELFSRCPDGITLKADQHLVPIDAGEGISNFSAILLDDDYYTYLNTNIITIEGIRIPHKKCLTVLKASAWINNRELFEQEKLRDIGTVHKHAFDICRLFAIYEDEDFSPSQIPAHIFKDIELAKNLFSDGQEVNILDQFLTATASDELPTPYSDVAEYLGLAFTK